MQTKYPLAPMLFGAVVIAVIAGVLGWSIRSRHAPVSEQAAVSDTPSAAPGQVLAPTARDFHNIAPLPQNQNIELGIQQRLLGKGAAISQSVAVARNKLQTQYTSEPVNAAWAARKQAALAAANDAPQISDLGAKPLAFNSTCRSTVCMIGADFKTTSAADDWFSMYTLVAGPEMSRAAVQRITNPDGTIHLQIYGLAVPSSR